MREALRALDLVVVIDVALTETAARPTTCCRPRRSSRSGSARSSTSSSRATCSTCGGRSSSRCPARCRSTRSTPGCAARSASYTDDDLAPLREPRRLGRAAFAEAFIALGVARPELARMAARDAVRDARPDTRPRPMAIRLPARPRSGGSRSAARSRTPTRSAGPASRATGSPLGEALFDAILATPHGRDVHASTSTTRRCAASRRPTRRSRWRSRGCSRSSAALADDDGADRADAEFPFVLAAGERRSSTANTIQRDPAWRKKDQQGALRVSSRTPRRLGLDRRRPRPDHDRARLGGRHGRGHRHAAGRPHHAAQRVRPRPGGSSDAVGVAPNELTVGEDRDWFAGTPHHKHVAPLERVPVRAGAAAGTDVRRTRFDERRARSPAPPT